MIFFNFFLFLNIIQQKIKQDQKILNIAHGKLSYFMLIRFINNRYEGKTSIQSNNNIEVVECDM